MDFLKNTAAGVPAPEKDTGKDYMPKTKWALES